ncbi:IS3 family transposase, partial [Glaesserella parasuis]|nr:IS3 family transposase [Glaesserella parasuis]MWQ58409.1 IS3 family transposase [Glaesserella parasuis]
RLKGLSPVEYRIQSLN